MSVLVTGSVAIDHIMHFEDHFRNHFISDKLEKLNVAFHVPQMSKQYGGTGANIAYNLRIVEQDPIVLATAGQDFAPYRERFAEFGFPFAGGLGEKGLRARATLFPNISAAACRVWTWPARS